MFEINRGTQLDGECTYVKWHETVHSNSFLLGTILSANQCPSQSRGLALPSVRTAPSGT